MSLIHNEQTKLTATYLNGLAMAIFAIGAVAPVVTIFSGGERALPWGCRPPSSFVFRYPGRYIT